MIIIISIIVLYTKVSNKYAVYKTSSIHVAGWVVSRAKKLVVVLYTRDVRNTILQRKYTACAQVAD